MLNKLKSIHKHSLIIKSMRNLSTELYEFFEATTIHGLAYLGPSHTKCTKIFWIIIILSAGVIASLLLYETILGFDTKYTSTTIETRNIKEFPFPAVTFHPGDYSSKKAFIKKFLNQFDFSRFQENDNFRENEKFVNKYYWLVSPMHNELFDGIEKYLQNEKQDFIKAKGGIFNNEVC